MRGFGLTRWVLLSLPGFVLLTPAPARAQGAGAEGSSQSAALFEQAKKHLGQKQYDVACPEFLQSYELDRTKAGVLYALAECYAEAGKLASAITRYTEYVSAVDGLPPDVQAKHSDRVTRAKAQQTTLAPQVPRVTLVVQGAAPETRVALDGQELSAQSLGAPLPTDPGKHRLTATSSLGTSAGRDFTLLPSERKTVELVITQGPAAAGAEQGSSSKPEPEPGATESSSVSGRRIGAYAALGVGGAGFLVMAITGGLVLGNKSAISDACPTQVNEGTRACTTQDGVDKAHTTQTLGLVSTVGFGVGIAGAALGAVLLLTEPKAPNQAGAPRWLALGPTSLGPEGVTIGARGAF